MLQLLRFLDWLLALPTELEERYAERHAWLEKEMNMPYRMKFEIDAETRGEARGLRLAALSVLEVRFAPLPADLPPRLDAITGVARLTTLARQAAVAPSLEVFLGALEDAAAQHGS